MSAPDTPNWRVSPFDKRLHEFHKIHDFPTLRRVRLRGHRILKWRNVENHHKLKLKVQPFQDSMTSQSRVIRSHDSKNRELCEIHGTDIEL